MCWSEDWQSSYWGVEMAIFHRCFPNFLISPLSLSYTVVLLSFPPPRSLSSSCLRPASSSVLLLFAVLWRQVPGAGKQQPADSSGDQGWRGRVPLRGQRRGPWRDRLCGHRCGGERWVTFWVSILRLATIQCSVWKVETEAVLCP